MTKMTNNFHLRLDFCKYCWTYHFQNRFQGYKQSNSILNEKKIIFMNTNSTFIALKLLTKIIAFKR